MHRHSKNPLNESPTRPKDEISRARQSSTGQKPSVGGRLLYWWSLFVAAVLLLTLGPPVISFVWLAGRREWLYPVGLFGARNWLRLSGMKVRVTGLKHLDPSQAYVFISNHRSYLDTATLFYYTGRRIGLLAKKELLKVPILGYGMGYVNILAIDRRSRESAEKTMHIATERLRSGISFGVFAEGTRAKPGEFLPFKKGAFYMAIQAGVPIVPIAMKNTDLLMGKGTGEARAGLIEMAILPPVTTSGMSTDDDVKQLSEKVHNQISRELGMADKTS